MGAFNSGALTVLITLNHLYPMTGAKTRNLALLPVRGISFLDYQLYPNTSHIHPHMCG